MAGAPIDLFASTVRLLRDGHAQAERRVFGTERDDWQMMAFHVETDADVHADRWEVHAVADEVVSCLTGGVRLYLRPERPGGKEEEITLTPGTAAVVPKGRWHRMELDAPSDIMSLAVPRGTRLERRAEG